MSRRELIRVLVIDDSAFSRQTITRMLEASPLVEVVGIARDGEEALRRSIELEPDLITLDLEMPRMDGFTFLRLLMARRPTPVIVVSGRAGEADVFQALELGAADFIAKPADYPTPELAMIQDELIRKVHAAREVRIDLVGRRLRSEPSSSAPGELRDISWPRLIALGASTGGPAALMHVLSAFSDVPDFAIVIAQHMPADFTRSFAARLDRHTVFSSREAADGEAVRVGEVVVARGGAVLEIEGGPGDLVTRVTSDPNERYAPSVDRLFVSAAKAAGSDLLGIVLTGMGDDGAKGVRAIKDSGGMVIAESEESAVIFGMPKQAIRTGAVDHVLALGDIPTAIRSGLAQNESGIHRRDSR